MKIIPYNDKMVAMNIYISGIGGAGLGPLAEIAQDAGHLVRGSDLQPSLATRELEARGVSIVYDQSADSIAQAHAERPIDWFVYTSALPETAEELQFVRQHQIKASKRGEFLAELITSHELELIAVAGTHGKTTTTALLVWVLKQLGIPVSYSIGTTLPFGASGEFDPAARYFVYEADEYDRNFLHFWPSISLLPSVDYDHIDIYPTVDDYRAAFRQFVSQSDRTVLWRQTADYLEIEPGTSDLTILDGTVSMSDINLPGNIMRANARLVLETLRQTLDDFDEDRVKAILAAFPGSDRRFEKLDENLYTDYGHHPIEIAATLEKARELANKVIVVYQPHQNLRQAEIMEHGGYGAAFWDADHVYWVPTYLVRADLLDGAPAVLAPADLIASLENPKVAEPAELDDALWRNAQHHLSQGDLVLFMGAGPIDDWLRQRLSAAKTAQN